ncbi:protein of unknown function [Sterolibacterium denitrificans]|uniref:Uncharacterized protein n=1 Tax=Sterolibacterium denitrificans TaxID=157592 RepID=A0A7Z7HRD3_9PROT|nr:protein of unknown function [Sterolibacterium denitrificans]
MQLAKRLICVWDWKLTDDSPEHGSYVEGRESRDGNGSHRSYGWYDSHSYLGRHYAPSHEKAIQEAESK